MSDKPSDDDEQAFWDAAYCAALNAFASPNDSPAMTGGRCETAANEALARRRKVKER